MLKQKIDQDLTGALKNRDALSAGALRMLKARIQNEAIARQKEFSDDELISIIASEVKRRKDSIDAYQKGNRPELAEKEQNEITVLHKYLPAQLSESEISEAIDRALAGKNFRAPDFGKAMGAVMSELKGKADAALISKILKEKLQPA